MSKPVKSQGKSDKHGIPVPDLTQPLDDTTARQLLSIPENERRLLHGLALWLNQHSMREASELAGCPYTTLRYRIQGAGLTEVDRNTVNERVASIAVQIMEEAGRMTMEGLRNGDISVSQAPVVYGIATDKLVKAAQLQQPKTDEAPLEKLIDLLKEGGHVTLSYERAVEPRTIDVESEDA